MHSFCEDAAARELAHLIVGPPEIQPLEGVDEPCQRARTVAHLLLLGVLLPSLSRVLLFIMTSKKPGTILDGLDDGLCKVQGLLAGSLVILIVVMRATRSKC